ncbi:MULTISPECIES: SDR family oxidoreductase [unclassified Sphingomonas]|uniref:SDR family oxidoreductase n=1 Tax=Novosphingobium rhizosphaerae TaxID=1551649 RepID=UPI0015C93320
MTQKVAIVTGASSGIGAAIAKRLAADGNAVIVNYAGNAAEADKVVAEITAAGGTARAVRADVGDSAAVAGLFDAAEAEFGGVDILVNNAGRAVRKPLAEFTDADFDAVVRTNLYGAFHAMREAANRLREGGRIVNISMSFQGAPIPGYGVYFGSKAAIEQLTAVAAKELGAKRITVNAVRPGPTRTPLFMAGKSAEVIAHFEQQIALGRLGEPEDVAGVVSFLTGPEGEWINGQSFAANGGYW